MFTCIRIFTRCDNSYECFGRSLICPHLVRPKTPESTRVKGLLGHVHSDDHKTIHVYSRVDKYTPERGSSIIDLATEKTGVTVLEWWPLSYGDYKNASNCRRRVREIDAGRHQAVNHPPTVHLPVCRVQNHRSVTEAATGFW